MQFLVETLKAWNKIHDPKTDTMLTDWNYSVDAIGIQAAGISTLNHLETGNPLSMGDVLRETIAKQALVGRA